MVRKRKVPPKKLTDEERLELNFDMRDGSRGENEASTSAADLPARRNPRAPISSHSGAVIVEDDEEDEDAVVDHATRKRNKRAESTEAVALNTNQSNNALSPSSSHSYIVLGSDSDGSKEVIELTDNEDELECKAETPDSAMNKPSEVTAPTNLEMTPFKSRGCLGRAGRWSYTPRENESLEQRCCRFKDIHLNGIRDKRFCKFMVYGSDQSISQWKTLLFNFDIQLKATAAGFPQTFPDTVSFTVMFGDGHVVVIRMDQLALIPIDPAMTRISRKYERPIIERRIEVGREKRIEMFVEGIAEEISMDCLKALPKKVVETALKSYDPTTGMLSLSVFLVEKAIRVLTFPAEAKGLRPEGDHYRDIFLSDNCAIQNIMHDVYDIERPREYRGPRWSCQRVGSPIYERRDDDGIVELFDACKIHHERREAEADAVSAEGWQAALAEPQHAALKPALRLYQRRAVVWMLEKERNRESFSSVTRDKPLAVATPPGGILADEMGLGKTVEILSLILCHPRPELTPEEVAVVEGVDELVTNHPQVARYHHDGVEKLNPSAGKFSCSCGGPGTDRRQRLTPVVCMLCGSRQHAECMHYDHRKYGEAKYRCPHCLVTKTPVPSQATLIVSPRSISEQWREEINKHVIKQGIKLLVYDGVNIHGFLQPRDLGAYDMVLTTYEVLKKEIDYVDLPHTRQDGLRLRHAKRFMAVPSPLTAVEWWRVCLDEAQMVENTTTKLAEMALRLSAVNRWCVTGTPINRGVDDLYGLLLFLGVDPYWVHPWWHMCLYEPFLHNHDPENLYDVVKKHLWRTIKKDVYEQLGLPAQTEKTHVLTFSPVEEHFYRRQYGATVIEARKNLYLYGGIGQDTQLNKLDRYRLHSLLDPLTKLRQACCHPQVVRGELIPLRKSTMTMQEVLTSLIRKVQLEAEEGQRLCVMAMNGLAGIQIIKGKLADAVNTYREVMLSVDKLKDEVRTDEIQQIHTLYNLNEILSQNPEGVAPTLRDHQIPEQIEALKAKFMKAPENHVATAENALNKVRGTLADITRSLRGGRSEWWLDVLQRASDSRQDAELVTQLKDAIETDNTAQNMNFAHSFNDVRGLQYTLVQRMQRLEKQRQELVDRLNRIRQEPSKELIADVAECCLRPAEGDELNTCLFCVFLELLRAYELVLYPRRDKANIDGPGTGLSQLEKALRSIHGFARGYASNDGHVSDGREHLKWFEVLKKEFSCMYQLLIERKSYVAKLDELEMTTTRLRVRMPHEVVPVPAPAHIIEKYQVQTQRVKLEGDKVTGRADMEKRLHQLRYLKNLERDQKEHDGANPEPCPICTLELGTKWAVMECGHCFCMPCIEELTSKNNFGRRRTVECPMCRKRMELARISYVSTVPDKEEEHEDISIIGSYSTKVCGVVRVLKGILAQDPKAKALVFSTWTDVLDIIGQALSANHIDFRKMYKDTKTQTHLKEWRAPAGPPVLLLTVQSGSKGLNLIEAQHVLLVEPLLHLSEEQQAIGRVHRIGQDRATTVHRFHIAGSIEERMYRLLQSVRTGFQDDELKVEDLMYLIREVDYDAGDKEEEDDDAASWRRPGDSDSEEEALVPRSSYGDVVNLRF